MQGFGFHILGCIRFSFGRIVCRVDALFLEVVEKVKRQLHQYELLVRPVKFPVSFGLFVGASDGHEPEVQEACRQFVGHDPVVASVDEALGFAEQFVEELRVDFG